MSNVTAGSAASWANAGKANRPISAVVARRVIRILPDVPVTPHRSLLLLIKPPPNSLHRQTRRVRDRRRTPSRPDRVKDERPLSPRRLARREKLGQVK